MPTTTKPKVVPVKHLTYYVVQTFRVVKGTRGKISADEPMPARHHDHAMALFERYKPLRAGVVAFHRTGDPATGEWEDAVIIARHGEVTAEIEEMHDQSDEHVMLGETDLRIA